MLRGSTPGRLPWRARLQRGSLRRWRSKRRNRNVGRGLWHVGRALVIREERGIWQESHVARSNKKVLRDSPRAPHPWLCVHRGCATTKWTGKGPCKSPSFLPLGALEDARGHFSGF